MAMSAVLFGIRTAGMTAIVAALGSAAFAQGNASPIVIGQGGPASEEADQRARPRFRVGPEFGAYLPFNGTVRSRFGDAWTGFGLGFGGVQRVGRRASIAPDFDIYSNNRRGDNRILVIPLTIQYRQAFTNDYRVRPYAAIGVGPSFVNMRVDAENIRPGIRTTWAGTLTAGVSFNTSGFVEARFVGAGKVRDFDLSGVAVNAGIRF